MNDADWLARHFETHRDHLRAVAYRMLGSLSEAEDAVQESWLRLSRSDTGDVRNLGGWLTTVVGRVCLDMLRSRRSRREQPWDVFVPDPVISPEDGAHPEQEALLADSVGLALLVVLDTLTPAERLAFVLRDMFAVPFEEIATIVGRSEAATRQLASRARRRVRGAPTVPDPDLARQREIVNAFLAAARGGDFDALVAVLDPEVVLRADHGAVPGSGAAGARGPAGARGSAVVRGAANVANQALAFSRLGAGGGLVRPALVNGAAGVVATRDGQPFSVLGFTVAGGRIAEIDILADPARLARLDLTVLD